MSDIREEIGSIKELIESKKNIENQLSKIIAQRKAEAYLIIAHKYHNLRDDMHGGEILLEKAPSPYQEHDYFLHAIAVAIVKKLSEPNEELVGFDISSIKKPEGFNLQLFLKEFNSFNDKAFGIYLVEKEGLLHVKLKNRKVKLHKP